MASTAVHGRNTYAWGVATCLMAQLCWSSMPVLQRYFGRFVDGYTQNGIRCSAAAAFLLPALLWALHRGRLGRMIWLDALPSAILATLSQTTWTLSLYRIDAGFAYFVAELQVVWAAVPAMWFFREERVLLKSPKFYVATLLAGAGFAALVLGARRPDALHVREAGLLWQGVLLAAACSVVAGLQTVFMRWRLTRYPAMAGYAVVSIYLAILLDAVMFWQGDLRAIGHLGPRMLLLVALSGVIGLAWANSFWLVGLKRIGVTISYGIALLAPFATSLISTLTLGEPLTGLQWIGGTVVVAGVVLLLLARRDAPAEPAPEPQPALTV